MSNWFQGVSKEYEQPVMEEYNRDLLGTENMEGEGYKL